MSVRVVARRPLFYREAPPAEWDLPPFVRAASGVIAFGGGLLVVQDDVDALALVDVSTGLASPVTWAPRPSGLRRFEDARGNKHEKLDLEACLVLPGGARGLAFGSGASAARTKVVRFAEKDERLEVSVVDATPFYDALRLAIDDPGGLNLEGAAIVGSVVRFFHRGNGATSQRGPSSVDVGTDELVAWLDAPTTPAPSCFDVRRYDLGEVGGVRLGFTDAVGVVGPVSIGGAAEVTGGVLFLAAAEDSRDAIADGVASGAAVGVLDGSRVACLERVVDEHGAPCGLKLEGIAATADGAVWTVVDSDDAARPAELCRIEGVRLSSPTPAG